MGFVGFYFLDWGRADEAGGFMLSDGDGGGFRRGAAHECDLLIE